MKFNITMTVELDDENVQTIGEHNLKYVLTDALQDFHSARTEHGTRSVDDYVKNRYPTLSAGEQIRKANQVLARLWAAADFSKAVHQAEIKKEPT